MNFQLHKSLFYGSIVKFVDKGVINLVHDYNGFTLTGTVDEKEFNLNKPVESIGGGISGHNY